MPWVTAEEGEDKGYRGAGSHVLAQGRTQPSPPLPTRVAASPVPDAAPHSPGASMAGPTLHRRPPAHPLGGPCGGIPQISCPLSSPALPGAPHEQVTSQQVLPRPSQGSACMALTGAGPETLRAAQGARPRQNSERPANRVKCTDRDQSGHTEERHIRDT